MEPLNNRQIGGWDLVHISEVENALVKSLGARGLSVIIIIEVSHTLRVHYWKFHCIIDLSFTSFLMLPIRSKLTRQRL